MKEYIFTQYLNNICSHLGTESSDLFVKSKEQRIVDARQLLYYFHEDQSNILRSVESFRQKVAKDGDLEIIINKLSDIKK